MIRLTFAAVTLAGSAWLCAAPAMAVTPALVLSPNFSETPGAVVGAAAKGAPTCTVAFTALSDDRRDPTTVGVVGNRAVQSPQDTQAWMKSVLGGLTVRGVTPSFEADAAGAPTAKFSLQMVWLTGVAVDFSANVVVAVETTGADGKTSQKTYRGKVARLNWASGSDEMQVAIDKAFSDVLNKMAPDLKQLCPA